MVYQGYLNFPFKKECWQITLIFVSQLQRRDKKLIFELHVKNPRTGWRLVFFPLDRDIKRYVMGLLNATHAVREQSNRHFDSYATKQPAQDWLCRSMWFRLLNETETNIGALLKGESTARKTRKRAKGNTSHIHAIATRNLPVQTVNKHKLLIKL